MRGGGNCARGPAFVCEAAGMGVRGMGAEVADKAEIKSGNNTGHGETDERREG